MDIALAVFDIAGTTVHDGDAVFRHLAMALARRGVEAGRDEINAVMGIAKPVAIRAILEARAPASDDDVDAVHRDFVDSMLSYYATSPEVYPVEYAEETFVTLRSVGIRIALDTGFSRPIAKTIVDRLGWLRNGLVDVLVTSDDVHSGRPAPEMIYHAMRLTGVNDPAKVAKIGDTPSDLMEGFAAGCRWIIGVTNGSHTVLELAAHPHTHLIASLAELPDILDITTLSFVGSVNVR